MPLVGFAFTDRALEFLTDLTPKLRRQVIRKAKALHSEPHPPRAKRLHDVITPQGDPVFRERSGDYRILYVVRSNPAEVIILDIADRKDVYRMPKTNMPPPSDMKMKKGEFDEMMRGALGVPEPATERKAEADAGRLAAYPTKAKKAKSTTG